MSMSEEINTGTDQPTADQPTEAQVMDAAIDDAVSETVGVKSETVEAQETDSPEPVHAKDADGSDGANGDGKPKDDSADDTASQTKEDLPKDVPETVVADDPDDEMGKTIREMEDDKDEDGNPNYDPKILKALKGLYEENRKLKSAGQAAERQTFFDKQFGSLDEGVRSHVDAPHKSMLKAKFDTLMAGYKATNAKVSQEDVFQEAAKLALGDLMEKAAEDRKTAALEERRRLQLARPGGESGHSRGKGPVTEEDIASEIWDQMSN